jgi:glycosyltransferase involved in cell wall biosynthesis
MRVIHVVPAVTEEASGPSYSVMRLCQSLIAAGEDVTLAALDWAPAPSKPTFMKVFPLGFGPRRLGPSPAMRRWLNVQSQSGGAGLLHNHGMWQMNSLYAGWASKAGTARLVVSPRGAFSVWAMNHGSRLKGIFWRVLQRPALEGAACFHATALSEYADIRRLGFTQPVAIIPNGIDVPEFVSKTHRLDRTLLFIGRIHQVKGLDFLLKAWSAVMNEFPEWRLVIAGTDMGYGGRGGYLGEMQALARALRLQRIEFTDAVYGSDKWDAYRRAELFVLPSQSENFGMTVAEALACGTAAIVSRGAPWDGLEERQCGWWTDIGTAPLIGALRHALALSREDLAQRGARGRDWMINEFSWESIGLRMDQTYRWLLNGGPVPSWVKTD